MASKKKQSEGIALLSMYNDDEDDEEMEDLEEQEEEEEQQQQQQDGQESREATNLEDDSRMSGGYDTGASDQTSTPQQPPVSFTSPKQHVASLNSRRSTRGRLTIVDYGHDEVAMSPEPEEGEIDLHNANDDFRERTPMGTETAEHLEQSQPDTMNFALMEMEAAVLQETVEVSEEADPLDKFLPSPPKLKCSEELQRKIDKFLGLKKIGKSFNAEVRNRKDYRNPDFLLHAVRYQDIDQIGSCFSKDVFDPHGYDQSDYYDEIEADMKREKERKDQENKRNQKVEFIPGVQPGLIAAAPKPNIPITGLSAAVAGGFHPVPTAVDAISRDGRQNKKSKWDKVDGDRRNPLPSAGQDSLSTVGAHSAILSAANAGAGYTAFAQQRRPKEHLGQTAAFQQVGAAYNQHLMVQRPRLPVLPTPVMPMPGGAQMNSPFYPGMRPPVMPRPMPPPGYMHAPGMPPMMAPPGAPPAPGQLNGLPRPPAVMNPTAAPGNTAPPVSSSGAPSMPTPSAYQANPTSGGFDSYNVNAQAPEANH